MHESKIAKRSAIHKKPKRDPMRAAVAGVRIEELRIQLDAFFVHYDETPPAEKAVKSARAKARELRAEAEARDMAQKELENTEFVKHAVILDAGCRNENGGIGEYTASELSTRLENEAIAQLTNDGSFEWAVLAGVSRVRAGSDPAPPGEPFLSIVGGRRDPRPAPRDRGRPRNIRVVAPRAAAPRRPEDRARRRRLVPRPGRATTSARRARSGPRANLPVASSR